MPWTDSVVRDILPNGLTLLVQRDSSVPVVAVVTHVKAGYFDEPDRWSGIAHVLEHMFFKGSRRHGPGVLAKETQRLGGYLNASTSYERTVYYAVVPAANGGLSRAVDLQADALIEPALDPAELARELEVIIQEAKRKLDTPSAVTEETLYELLFRIHRMRRWRIGTEAGLRALTDTDVRAYHASRYTPDRVIVALTGNLDVDAALALGREVYGAWRQPGGVVEPSPAEPDGRMAAFRVLRGDVERPLAALGWRTVGPDHADAPALDVASAILGSGHASWLSTAVRVPGLASSANASHYTPGDVGVFDVGLTSDVGRLGSAVRRSVGLATALGRDGPDGLQLARVRALYDTYWARRRESADLRGTLLAEFEARGGYQRAVEYATALTAVTADDVRRVAATWLTPDAVSGVVYLPGEASIDLDEGDWPVFSHAAGPRPVTQPPTGPGPRSVPPTRDERIGDIEVLQWPGADLVVRPRPSTGMVALGVYLPGLPGHETAADAGISRLLARAALRGAGHRSAEEVATAAEMLGGAIGTHANVDTVGFTLAVRTQAARDGLSLLRTLLESPTLDPEDVTREAAQQADDASRRRDDMFGHPLEAVIGAAFGEDPYGLPAYGDPEIVRGLDAAALHRWHDRAMETRALIVAAGDLSAEELRSLGAVFADWPAASGPAAAVQPRWTPRRPVDQRSKAQTALAMAFPAEPAAADDRYAHAVLSALLSGLAGRLFDELRERRALAYTVYASPWLRRRGGAVLTYIATSPEREDEARTAMLDVLGRVADDPIPDEELERARAYAAGLVAIRRQQTAAVAGELADAWAQDRLAAFGAEEERRRAVTADALRALARGFVAERRAEYVLRGTGGGR